MEKYENLPPTILAAVAAGLLSIAAAKKLYTKYKDNKTFQKYGANINKTKKIESFDLDPYVNGGMDALDAIYRSRSFKKGK